MKRQACAKVTERLWDWQGEYWADEVGYYRIDTASVPKTRSTWARGQHVRFFGARLLS